MLLSLEPKGFHLPARCSPNPLLVGPSRNEVGMPPERVGPAQRPGVSVDGEGERSLTC